MQLTTLTDLGRFIESDRRLTILTGAGISTGSGIPDYRDRNGEWKHSRPVMFEDFMKSTAVRQRYWARTTVGWQRMAKADPGVAHHAIKALQDAGVVDRLITQNVDGLHQKAGSTDVIDLHGRLDEVRCQSCGWLAPRADWQSDVAGRNRDWLANLGVVVDAPDGDAIIENADYGQFDVPDCPVCGGIVKPEVVFFGENVPRDRVDAAYQSIADADALLVAGSSLMVFSGYRFARRCHELGKPLVLINEGVTRADELATLKIGGDCGEQLKVLAEQVSPSYE